jgi:anti-sigma regulatory factor (Ser/Thr protein kinase)
MSKSTVLVIPSEESRLGEVREVVSHFCRSAGLPERGTANLRLAVDQVCSYGIQQAYAGTSGQLRVELEWKKGWVDVRVKDSGAALEGLEKDKDLIPWLEGQGEGQQATVLLHNLVEELSYKPAKKGKNVWCLRKKLPKRPL